MADDFADQIVQDVRYATRWLRQSPGVSIVAAILLSLGIGLNAAVVTVLDRVMLRTPPGVRDAANVRRVHEHVVIGLTRTALVRDAYSFIELDAMARSVAPAATTIGYAAAHVPTTGANGPYEPVVTAVLGDYFGVLGIPPAIGRSFGPEEVGRDGPVRHVVISDRVWSRDFGRRPDVIGQTTLVGKQRFEVIGVAPPEFHGIDLEEVDFWIPFNASESAVMTPHVYTNRMDVRFHALVRMPSLDRQPAIDGLLASALRAVNVIGDGGATVRSVPLAEALDPRKGKSTVGVLARLVAAGVLVFVIACSNVANLLLIRLSRRRQEVAIRFALGVSRARLARQLLTEGMLLAVVAGIPAALTAVWGFSALTKSLLPGVALDLQGVALRGFVVVVALAGLGGLAIGALPALYLRDPDLATALRGGIDSTPRASRIRGVLLVLQTVLSVVLLAGAGLFVRSLVAVEALGFGYHAKNVWFASAPFDPQVDSAGSQVMRVTVAEAERRLAAMPGVTRAAMTAFVPLQTVASMRLALPGRDSVPSVPGEQQFTSVVSPGYLAVIGSPLLRGRDFTMDDRIGSEPVIMVSAAMAERFWPGEDALQKCVSVGGPREPCRRVVGVVDDVRAFTMLEPQSLRLYLPAAQVTTPWLVPRVVVFELDPDAPRSMPTQIRSQLAEASSLRWDVTSMASIIEPEMRPWRLSAMLVAALGVVAAIVAGIGTYGTTSYAVSQRMHELSVRRVLGAETGDIVSLVFSGTMRLVMLGALIGVGVVLGLEPVVGSMLYGVTAHDPASLGVAVALQAVSAIAACVVPVLAAARAAPAAALAAQ